MSGNVTLPPFRHRRPAEAILNQELSRCAVRKNVILKDLGPKYVQRKDLAGQPEDG